MSQPEQAECKNNGTCDQPLKLLPGWITSDLQAKVDEILKTNPELVTRETQSCTFNVYEFNNRVQEEKDKMKNAKPLTLDDQMSPAESLCVGNK
jgi:hypothetical protein